MKSLAGRYGSTKHMQCCMVIPPFVLESIAMNSKGAAAKAALNSLTLTGQLLGKRNSIAAMRMPAPTGQGKQRTVYDDRHSTRVPGVRVLSEGGSANAAANVNAAYKGAGDTYDLYQQCFGRNSVDDHGSAIDSTINYGRNYQNAFFDGQGLRFGNGDGVLFKDFTCCPDVICHEFSHWFTSGTSNLQYLGQSGALNESISDCFGSMLKQRLLNQTADKADWVIGSDLLTPKVQGRGIRDMLNPGTAYDDASLGKDPQPASMDDYVQTEEDNSGVHLNSGIPNRAFAVACVAVGGFSWEKVGKVWYETCTRYLTYSSDFADMARGTVANAAALFGAGGPVELAVRAGWDAVRIRV